MPPLYLNPSRWSQVANVVYLESPAGVGFSYGDSGDYDHDEKGVRDDMYHFLTAFFAAHPEYATNDFFVFGESYGGHYAPNVAYRILEVPTYLDTYPMSYMYFLVLRNCWSRGPLKVSRFRLFLSYIENSWAFGPIPKCEGP